MKDKLFCNFCGKGLTTISLEGRSRLTCAECGEIHYENPLPVAAVIVANTDRELLLVKRANEPYKDMWCFPIGFAELGESIEDAALRELEEEAGISGRISQLVDVSSESNSLYGELLIVTFEAEKIGGEERAGDDASECQYFPVMNLPKLAFASQKKSVEKFIELKRDLWSMHDSMETLVETTIHDRIVYPGKLLSDELVKAVQSNSRKIVELWLSDIATNPSTCAYHDFDRNELYRRAMFIIGEFGLWLRREKLESEQKRFYNDLGIQRRKDGVPLEDLVSSLSLLKKHIWMFTYSFGVWEKAVDIYRMFELGERLVYFFDKAAYYTVMGYFQAGPARRDH